MATPDHERSSSWTCTFELTGEKVWHAFRLHALLQDAHRRGDFLVLPQCDNQETRLDRAVKERNTRIAAIGDIDARMHSCDICHVTLPNSSKNSDELDVPKGVSYIRAAVD